MSGFAREDWREGQLGALDRRRIDFMGVLAARSGFVLRIFSVSEPSIRKSDVRWTDPFQQAELCTQDLVAQGLSSEFDYHRKGFFIRHAGRRGTTSLLYHFGVWTDMPEVFTTSWYRYRNSDTLEQLDFREPISCWHELDLIRGELGRWKEFIDLNMQDGQVDWARVYRDYFRDDI
ncbi:hypothetical protein BJF78_15850 [Pseudonocardia sp. CNS-139]|nr:hypothetical protein BJF78_15850 [Pseudonocardia sp. CNS-139]